MNILRKFNLLLIALAFIFTIAGCTPHISPAAKLQVQKVVDARAVAVAKQQSADEVKLTAAKGKHAVDAENGINAPVTHPIAAANETVKKLRTPLIVITTISFTLWLLFFGLSKTQYASFTLGLTPARRWIWVLSVVGVFALPFMPAGIVALIIALIGLVVYEFIKDKGDPQKTESDVEQLLGFNPSNQTSGGSSSAK